MKMFYVFVKLLLFVQTSSCFYLPGNAPVNYCKEDSGYHTKNYCQSNIDVYSNRLRSNKILKSLSYDRFDFCENENNTWHHVSNLGQVIFGDRFHLIPFKFKFLESEYCKVLCSKRYVPKQHSHEEMLKLLKFAIKKDYSYEWLLDDVPVSWCYANKYCAKAFPMGCFITKGKKESCAADTHTHFEVDKYYLFNHFDFVVYYHGAVGNDIGRIIRIEIRLKSIDHKLENGKLSCYPLRKQVLPKALKKPLIIHYTYGISYKKIDTLWSNRWNEVLTTGNDKVVMFSALNGMIIVMFLSFVVYMSIEKIKTDINHIESEDCEKDFYLLVIMHNGDLFRSPNFKLLLSVFVGTGLQVFITCFVTLLFGAAGFLSPANPGALATCALLLYICFGFIGGFTCARIYKITLGNKWFETAIIQSVFLPGMTFSVILLLNIIHIINHSSAALPYDTTLIVVGLWLGLHVPFTLLGAYLGFKRKSRVAKLSDKPREIPRQKFCVRPSMSFISSGILAFGSIFIQLFFIFNSIWFGQIYYMFGWLLLIFCICSTISMQTTIYLSAFHIHAQDYRWWWRSFITSASSGFYMIVYMIYYYIAKLSYSDFASAFLYFGYSLLIAFVFAIMSGSIGFLATLYFVKKIHRPSKTAFVMSQIGDKISFNSLLDNPDVSLSGNQDINDDDLKVQIKGNTNDEFYSLMRKEKDSAIPEKQVHFVEDTVEETVTNS